MSRSYNARERLQRAASVRFRMVANVAIRSLSRYFAQSPSRRGPKGAENGKEQVDRGRGSRGDARGDRRVGGGGGELVPLLLEVPDRSARVGRFAVQQGRRRLGRP